MGISMRVEFSSFWMKLNCWEQHLLRIPFSVLMTLRISLLADLHRLLQKILASIVDCRIWIRYICLWRQALQVPPDIIHLLRRRRASPALIFQCGYAIRCSNKHAESLPKKQLPQLHDPLE